MDILEIPITMMYCPFRKKKAEVVINPTTGKIVSVNQLQLKKQKDYAKSEINDKTILFFARFNKIICNY